MPQRAPISPFPHCEDKRRTRDALSDPGVALVVSLWKAEDLSWLDGGCNQWTAQGRGMCNLVSTSFSISNQLARVGDPEAAALAALVAASDANTSATPSCAAGRHDGGARLASRVVHVNEKGVSLNIPLTFQPVETVSLSFHLVGCGPAPWPCRPPSATRSQTD